ncbi:HlyD family efflux transporter periplasmic adaptor subunit [Xanthomonas campestris pv. papavericola]|uniref:HlyD family efflux transporter periplasmic adaptor subunit n=2 Tax=Xanthomonas campestris TaxID=339 RepID=A0AAJ3CFL0_XANCA|nr:HlyD family efflux transporter periplasmic adaptor subunit [Xanthomonas campestris]MEC3889280.1 HlyD family efflux transporter periplasmic adaptor subunit [Xanthomonas campestris pv. papavericola]
MDGDSSHKDGMENSLFRKRRGAEATSVLGDLKDSFPPSIGVWVIVGCVLFLLMAVFVLTASYAKREHVSGQIVSTHGRVDIRSVTAGLVLTTTLKPGVLVRKNQVLAELSADVTDEAGRSFSSEAIRRAHDRLQELTRERARGAEFLLQREQELTLQIEEAENALTQASQKIAILKEKSSKNRELLRTIEPLLVEKYVSKFTYLTYENALLDAEAQIQDARAQQSTLRNQRAALLGEITEIKTTASRQASEIEREKSTIEDQVARAKSDRLQTITSPLSGTVAAIYASQGQRIGTDSIIASITPSESVFEAEILIPSRAIGHVTVGTEVLLNIAAFPKAKYGAIQGRIASLSTQTSPLGELERRYGRQSPTEPVYTAKVALPSQTIGVAQEAKSFLPGMEVDAELILEGRKIWEWMFDPFQTMGSRLTGEKR